MDGIVDISGCNMSTISEGFMDISGCTSTIRTMPEGFIDISGCNMSTISEGFMDISGCTSTISTMVEGFVNNATEPVEGSDTVLQLAQDEQSEQSEQIEKVEEPHDQTIPAIIMDASSVYDTITPITNATLHRMHKIVIENENLRDFYMNNLIQSIIRDVIGHARRRLKTIRYTSLGITKQVDDIYKAKGLYKEHELMEIKKALQVKFPSADIRILKQTPISENHIPVQFTIAWNDLELGEVVEEDEPVIVKAEGTGAVTANEEPAIAKQEENIVEGFKDYDTENMPVPAPVVKVETQAQIEARLNKQMDTDYAIQRFRLRLKHRM